MMFFYVDITNGMAYVDRIRCKEIYYFYFGCDQKVLQWISKYAYFRKTISLSLYFFLILR